ncbi:MAG: L-rhamnose mutarotase [Bryobacterales bacterium]
MALDATRLLSTPSQARAPRRVPPAPRSRLARNAHSVEETGWRNYSLFLRDDGLLVGYFETPDLSAALAGMEAREVNARWQREMAPFFESLEGKRPDEAFLRLPEIFHLD